jgi:hypothetical protein
MGPSLDPVPIGPSPPWVMVVGAAFGGATLLGFFLFAYLAGTRPEFICNAFAILAVIFALGASLSAGFIGGAAAINGSFGSAGKDNAVAFSAGGGIAVLFIALWTFNSYFKEDVCKGLVSKVAFLEQKLLEGQKTADDREKKIWDLTSDYEKRLSESDKRMNDLRSQPITIVARTDQASSTPLNQLLVTFTGKQGPQLATRVKGTNVFKIPRQDLDDNDPGIYLSIDPLLSPQADPGTIVVERIDHNIDPLRISLTLHYSHVSQQPHRDQF